MAGDALPTVEVTTLRNAPGAPVLVVGPSLGTAVERLWGAVAAEIDDVHVVGWDLPGHGLSPAATRGFDLADLAAAVLAAVDRAVGAGPASYLYAGDSVGGAVGLQLLLDHPTRFGAAAVLCSAARFGTPDAWADRAALVRSDGMTPMVASSPGRWFGTRLQAAPTERSRGAVADLAEVDPGSYAFVCEAIGRYDVTQRLGEIAAPVLVVAGSDDVATPAAQLEELARALPRARFVVLPGIGHLAPLEDPARTAELLRQHVMAAAADRA